METPPEKDITELLLHWNDDRKEVIDRLMPLVVSELKRLAQGHLWREGDSHTLQPTALVNELYLRLVDRRQVDWRSRAQFFAFASHTMRRILVDYARGKRAQKRGGGAPTLLLDDAGDLASRGTVDLLELNQALEALGKVDPALVRIVEMRFFAGLTFQEIASVLELSPATVSRRWKMAKGWLYRHLGRS